ncbi:putative ankyrin repeat protein RF_0381 [Haliotis rufescens]|uniref:putative ankyrin repeat protein RF_0381 n=1 Tax=Haliotis rufescens TaxID=6454 RepID=UPI00201F57E3|nr:putative ankyrin repeat protein RF_0381 [Haliotis rufescens]
MADAAAKAALNRSVTPLLSPCTDYKPVTGSYIRDLMQKKCMNMLCFHNLVILHRMSGIMSVRAGVCAFNTCQGSRCLETRAGTTACVKGGHNQAQRQTTVITTLIDACTVGDLPQVKYILSQDIANINKRGKKGMTPAMIAAQKGHREILELLVKKGADLCLLDDDDNSILHVASKEGNVEIVKYIHSQNIIDIESRGDYGNTPVMFAALFGKMEVLFFLVKIGADLSKLNEDGENILHLSSRGGDVEIVNYVLTHKIVDINSRTYALKTPLMLAAMSGTSKLFQLLIERGADIAQSHDSTELLEYACKGGDVDIVKCVLNLAKVDINCDLLGGATPLLYVALLGHTEVFKLLVRKGADVTKVDDYKENILHRSCEKGNLEIVRYIHTKNIVDLNSEEDEGMTAVLLAAQSGTRDVFDLLAERGADVSVVNTYGKNILHLACDGEDKKIVKYVLTQNIVDINSKQNEGMTAVLLAAQSGTRAWYSECRSRDDLEQDSDDDFVLYFPKSSFPVKMRVDRTMNNIR